MVSAHVQSNTREYSAAGRLLVHKGRYACYKRALTPAGALSVTDDVRHAGLEAKEGRQGRRLGRVILGELVDCEARAVPSLAAALLGLVLGRPSSRLVGSGRDAFCELLTHPSRGSAQSASSGGTRGTRTGGLQDGQDERQSNAQKHDALTFHLYRIARAQPARSAALRSRCKCWERTLELAVRHLSPRQEPHRHLVARRASRCAKRVNERSQLSPTLSTTQKTDESPR